MSKEGVQDQGSNEILSEFRRQLTRKQKAEKCSFM